MLTHGKPRLTMYTSHTMYIFSLLSMYGSAEKKGLKVLKSTATTVSDNGTEAQLCASLDELLSEDLQIHNYYWIWCSL